MFDLLLFLKDKEMQLNEKYLHVLLILHLHVYLQQAPSLDQTEFLHSDLSKKEKEEGEEEEGRIEFK